MALMDKFIKRFKCGRTLEPQETEYEYCPHCEANLTLQKGYDNHYPYWICKGCGEMLINPDSGVEDGVVWVCDKCGAMLNLQENFESNTGSWACLECGFVNKICRSEIYVSDEEYQAELRNPYRGLSDEEILSLSVYEDIGCIDDRSNVILVKDKENGTTFIKKLLTIYDRSIYESLMKNPVPHIPKIHKIYEGENCLIIIEEYIEGKTVAEMLDVGTIPQKTAIGIAFNVCKIIDDLHNLPFPIVHRDIKPSNIIVTPKNEVYLIDMNVAKWYVKGEADDGSYMGTAGYAAPEQVGYGFSASSAKTDVYAVGMLLNVMLTGKFPKEEKASGEIWSVIEQCIKLNSDERISTPDLITSLLNLKGD